MDSDEEETIEFEIEVVESASSADSPATNPTSLEQHSARKLTKEEASPQELASLLGEPPSAHLDCEQFARENKDATNKEESTTTIKLPQDNELRELRPNESELEGVQVVQTNPDVITEEDSQVSEQIEFEIECDKSLESEIFNIIESASEQLPDELNISKEHQNLNEEPQTSAERQESDIQELVAPLRIHSEAHLESKDQSKAEKNSPNLEAEAEKDVEPSEINYSIEAKLDSEEKEVIPDNIERLKSCEGWPECDSEKSAELLEVHILSTVAPEKLQPEPEPPKGDPRRVEAHLVRDEKMPVFDTIKSIEKVHKLDPLMSSEPRRIRKVETEIRQAYRAEAGEHQDDIELQVEESPQEVEELESVAEVSKQDQPEVTLIKVIEDETETLPEGTNQPPIGGDDETELEWEFDNEPPFESRLVELKRNKDPRSEYELCEELGRGRFGTVFKCTDLSTGFKLAAKFVNLRRSEDREDVEREVAIMSILQHRRLLQLYDAYDDPSRNEMCLITELVEGGELFERVVDHDFELTEKKAAIFMRQICEGVEYMHSKAIVHLDMKPENILCISKSCNRIKLIDFGLARELKAGEQLRVMFGTPDFAAPEVLAYDLVSLATDMWSVGVICYVLLSGLSPFMGNNDMETMANVTRATFDFDDEAFDPISELAKDFISGLLVKEPSRRLKPEECLKHAWLARGGRELQASALNSRRQSVIQEIIQQQRQSMVSLGISAEEMVSLEKIAVEAALAFASSISNSPVSLDKRNLRKYVVRRKWHKTVHAIMALGRMGANLKLRLSSATSTPAPNSPVSPPPPEKE